MEAESSRIQISIMDCKNNHFNKNVQFVCNSYDVVMSSISKHRNCCSGGQNGWRGDALEFDILAVYYDIYCGMQWLKQVLYATFSS